jgi:type IV secretory pathway VirB2 component (pilin)
MVDIPPRVARLRGWIDSRSRVARLAVLVIALILFVIAQRLATVSSAGVDTTLTMVVASIIALVLAVVSVAAVVVVVWSFAMALRDHGLFD